MSKEGKNKENKRLTEKEVFKQRVSDEELEQVTGGDEGGDFGGHDTNCTSRWYRGIHSQGCAATVEDGSDCMDNDACWDLSVLYYEIRGCDWFDCSKARD